MSNLAKLEITVLDIYGKNYMTWAVGVKMHLKESGLLNPIVKSETTTDEKKIKAMIFLRHHIHDVLKDEYITEKNPVDLWQSLNDRFDHHKYVMLPKAKHEWLNLRFQNYKSVTEYNFAIFGITSKIMLCGESVSDYDMNEKTLQIFHPENVILEQKYRTNEFTRYSELMQVLLVATQNNEIMIMNHETRPTGSAPLPKRNVVVFNTNCQGQGRGRGSGRSGWRGRGQVRVFQPNNFNAEKTNIDFQENKVCRNNKRKIENACYRCGMKGHWVRTCRTPKHLADRYQKSQKEKGKNVETNFISDEAGPSFSGLSDDTHLDVANFIVDPEVSTEMKDN